MPDLLQVQTGIPCHSVHRLDFAVGGVMLFAKTKEAMTHFTAMMQAHRIEKTYLAVTDGIVTPDADALCDLLYHDKRQNRSFVVDTARKGVKEARLTYQTLAKSEENGTSLLQVQLQTGRTHQIRVQFASRKTPLFGDGKYGSRKKGEIGLWSHSLALELDGKQRTFTAPPPKTAPFSTYADILFS